MKLAIVTAFPPSKVTLNEYAYYLVKGFRNHPQVSEIVLLTDVTESEARPHLDIDGCRVTINQCWKFNCYFNSMRVLEAVKECKPDAILFNLQFMKFGDKKVPAALGLRMPMLCKRKGIPTIVLMHNILEQVDLGKAGFTSNKLMQKSYAAIGTLLTKMVLKADRVAFTIKGYVDIIEQKYGVRNVILIPHGTLELPPEPSYSLPAGPLQVMTFGKFGTYKKVEILIEAVKLIRARTDLNIEIVIAGENNPNVAGYLEGVKARYADVEQIRFTGYVAEEQVAPLFNESAVVIFPYTSTTGSSGVLHQAGSYGKAVVLPDLGDLAALIKEEGYRGSFFDPLVASSLADAIQQILENEPLRIELGKANYKAATALPMSKIADLYVQEFERLIASHK